MSLSHLTDDSNIIDTLYQLCKENQIDQVQNFLPKIGNINIINKIQTSTGSTCLHVACYYGHRTMVKILLDYGAQHSIRNTRHNLTPYEETTSDEIKELLIEKQQFFAKNDYNRIEWSMIGDDLLEKRRQFRRAIDLYKTYDNHHLISKLLVEVIQYYINEYLINQNTHEDIWKNDITLEQIAILEEYFKEAIVKQDYLTYFIKAYTLTNFFYRILNKDLALYILEYIDQTRTFSSNYRIVICLVHIVTLLIYHPDLPQYEYRGICYRGMRITQNDLNQYQLNQHILNRAFLSTSKDRSVAEMFAGVGQQSQMRYTPPHQDYSPLQYSCLCRYLIKQKSTAINIQSLSARPDEEEVLIIPFSVFKVIEIKQHFQRDRTAPISIEIELEECEDTLDSNNNKHPCQSSLDHPVSNEVLSSSEHLIKDTEAYIKFKNRKYFYCYINGILVSIIILALIVASALTLFIKRTPNLPDPSSDNDTILEYQLPLGCPNIMNRSSWNARSYKTREKLIMYPVTHIVVRQLPGWRSGMNEQQDCIKAIRDLQDFQMDQRGWFDVAYNFLICNDQHDRQKIYRGRGWTYMGAHCVGYNEKSLGIGILGDYTSKNSLNTFKSFIQCGISKNAVATNFTLVTDSNSTDIYEYYLEYFKNDTNLHYSNQRNKTHYFCD